MRSLRSALVVAFVILASTMLPFPTEAAGPVAPTLSGGTWVAAGRNWSYAGQLVVDATGTPVALADQTVGVYLDGVRVREDATDAAGRYSVRVNFAPGTHVLEARVFEGELIEGASDPLVVKSYPTWPAGPSLIEIGPGPYYNMSNVTWLDPWTDGGYPILHYNFSRSHNGGPFVPLYGGLDLGFTDFDIIPGDVYTYRGTATTAYATSNATFKTYFANDTIATIEVVGFKVCDATNCTVVPDGGAFNTTSIANVTVEAHTQGIVDTYPVSPPGVGDIAVHGQVHLPEIARLFLRYSAANGTWSAQTADLWAHAPATGCETIDVLVQARTQKTGRTEDTGSFDLCIA